MSNKLPSWMRSPLHGASHEIKEGIQAWLDHSVLGSVRGGSPPGDAGGTRLTLSLRLAREDALVDPPITAHVGDGM
jgi:hypothetical protein